MNCFLGIDGGGSKTICLIIDEDKNIIARGEAGAANYQTIGITKAQESIISAVNNAISQINHAIVNSRNLTIQSICLGLAGVSRTEDIILIKSILEDIKTHLDTSIINDIEIDNLIVTHDALIALVGGIGIDVGIVVAAGTGSIIFGQNSQGITQRVGGWGYLLGDEGSAYHIAVSGIRAAFQAYDGSSNDTSLQADLIHHLNLNNLENLIPIIYRNGWGVKEIAALAPIVDRAAAKGDRVANEIMNQAVDYLVTASSSVVERIFTPGIRLEIVTTGSVWQSQWGMWEKFSQGITGKYDFVGVILPRNEPAFGAALLARNTYQSS